MFLARKPFVRSTTLLAVSAAATLVLMSSGVAQERGGRADVAAVGQQPPSPVLNPRHPESYVVQRGDTLWDIASMFLRDPWYWPEIWQINPQVANPHLIYPGDILSLVYLDDGRPAIQLERGPVESGSGVVRLSPRVRSEPLEEAIFTIPYETIKSFLSRPRFIEKRQIDDMPYVVALREALIGSAGHDVYVRGFEEQAPVGTVFNVVELGGAFVDPDTHDVLGYQGTYVGQGRLDRTGDPGTLRLLETEREALVGDLLAEEEDAVPLDFIPRAPESEVEGQTTIIMILPEGTFTYTKGKPKSFRRKDLETPVSREFCADCGTQILARAPGLPGMVILKVGTLDDPGLFAGPQMAIHLADKQKFHHVPDGIATFEHTPG